MFADQSSQEYEHAEKPKDLSHAKLLLGKLRQARVHDTLRHCSEGLHSNHSWHVVSPGGIRKFPYFLIPPGFTHLNSPNAASVASAASSVVPHCQIDQIGARSVQIGGNIWFEGTTATAS